MKLIVAGASGFVSSEIIRQSLGNPQITSVIAIARRSVSAPSNLGPGADASKLSSVVVDNYGSYSDDVKQQLADADACIWTVAITPTKSRNIDFNEVRKVCHDYTIAGLQAMIDARNMGGNRKTLPFRFMYMSGAASERDQTKTPSFMAKYCLMRGETENAILAIAAEYKGAVEPCVAKPGLITAPGQYLKTSWATVLQYVMSVPNIDVAEISAAMIHELINGFEKEPLMNEDLVRIGRKVLKGSK